MASFVTNCRPLVRRATGQWRQELVSRGFGASPGPMSQKYPLLPSVEHLLRVNGLDISAVERMKSTGPKGRLLKGDVLAYLGTIPSSYPAELSNRIEKLSHLDLSSIKIATVPSSPKAGAEPAPPSLSPSEPITTEVTLPISLAAVVEVKNRIERSIGVSLPLETFIDRATDIANDNLPRSATTGPSADELFNEVLGLSKISSSGTRGNFLPQITAIPAKPAEALSPPEIQQDIDIIEFLASKQPVPVNTKRSSITFGVPEPDFSTTTNTIGVSVKKGDEKRARVFLERLKVVLESEPGRLVL